MNNRLLNNKIIAYTNHEVENFKNGKVRIMQNDNDLINFIEMSKRAPSNVKLYFGKIGCFLANEIKENIGIDIENYNISLKTDAIRHIINHHSKDTELLRGQLPIICEDFKIIPKIIATYDKVYLSGMSKNNKLSVTFEKLIYSNYCIVCYISNKCMFLEIQTMYKRKTSKKELCH